MDDMTTNMNSIFENLSCPFDDIVNGQWNNLYPLRHGLPLYFKLHDHAQWMWQIQNKMESDFEFKQLIEIQQKKIDDLQQVKIWVRSQNGILKLTLLDVYKSFSIYLKEHSFDETLFRPSEVSLMGPLGPFKKTALVSCLNKELTGCFIFNCLLKKQLQNRSLRVHAKGQVKTEYGADLSKTSFLQVKQITESGILFSSHCDEFKKIDHQISQGVKIYLDTDALSKLTKNEKDIQSNIQNEMFYTNMASKVFEINQTQMVRSYSYQSMDTNEIYYYCRYIDMLESQIPTECSKFIASVKHQISLFVLP